MKGSINNAATIDSVSVTPKPNSLNGSKTNQIIGYINNKIKAIGQQSTNNIAHKTRLINNFILKMDK